MSRTKQTKSDQEQQRQGACLKRATTIELWSGDGYNMVSSWTDTLWLTRRKDGTFSVKPKKYCEGETWQFDSVCKLRTPEQFVDGVLKAWEALGRGWGDGEVLDLLPTVATLDSDFAANVEQYINAGGERDENETEASERGTVIGPEDGLHQAIPEPSKICDFCSCIPIYSVFDCRDIVQVLGVKYSFSSGVSIVAHHAGREH